MRNILKATTLESKFPLLAVEGGCIISKDADITVAYRVELPELFTVTSAEYEAIHAAWCKALKVLPEYSVVHKQDWFIRERYRPATGEGGHEFPLPQLRAAFQRASVPDPRLLPLPDENDEGAYAHAFRLLDPLPGQHHSQRGKPGIGDKIPGGGGTVRAYSERFGFSWPLSASRGTRSRVRRIVRACWSGTFPSRSRRRLLFRTSSWGPRFCAWATNGCACTRSRTRKTCRGAWVRTPVTSVFPPTVRTACSFAAPVGLLLSCDHLYNQYVFLEDSDENLRMFEKRARNMQSLSRYSRGNQINKEWIDQYLNEAHSFGLQSVRAHFNVLAWSDDVQELRHIRNDVGSQLALMECRPRHNTVDAATLYWAGMPGNAGDFPAEESFYTFIEPAVCFFTEETNYKSSSSPFGIKLCDRISGRPLHLDISDEPMKKGIITNRNKFVLGGSGSGKSFFMNHLVRQYWEQGTHVVLVDTGNSYQGLCELIRRKTKGEDGVYFTYTEEHPISFNPFYTDDYYFDVEKKDSIKTLLLTLWKTEDDKITKTESGELGSAVNAYIERIRADRNIVPCFDSFYEYLRDDYRRELEEREIRVSREDFNIDNMLITLRQYYKGGRYDFLLNSRANIDLLSKRFVVFEVDSIKENKELFFPWSPSSSWRLS